MLRNITKNGNSNFQFFYNIKTIFMISFLTVFLFNEATHGDELKDHGVIEKRQFYIGKITLGQTKEEIIKYLGEPLNIERGIDEATGSPSIILKFNGISAFLLIDNRLYDINCESDKIKTPDGIKVGDNIEKVFKIYGAIRIKYHNGQGTLNYWLNGTDAKFVFVAKNYKVLEISLWLNYL